MMVDLPEPLGLFRAATLKCREHNIWGSAFAVKLGVADERQAGQVAEYFRDHYGELVKRGPIRHTPFPWGLRRPTLWL